MNIFMKRFNPGDLVTRRSHPIPEKTLSIVLSYKSEDGYCSIFDINNFIFLDIHYSYLKKASEDSKKTSHSLNNSGFQMKNILRFIRKFIYIKNINNMCDYCFSWSTIIESKKKFCDKCYEEL